MAQIDLVGLKKVDKERHTIHEKATTTYSVFEIHGERYFQIDTYGKSDREMPGKVSQSLQFDKTTAKYLVNLMIDVFDLN